MHAGYCNHWIVPTLGHIPLGKITPADVTRLMLAMKEAGKAESTRRNCYTALRKALDDAVVNGLLAANPVHRIKQPSARRSEARFLTLDEVALLMKAAQGLRYVDALRLILGTGLRRGEACALRWEDIDLVRGEAKVNGSLVRQNGGLRVVDTKTDKSRRKIALSAHMLALLKSQKARQAAERLTAGNLWVESGLVFTTDLGKPIEPQNLLRTVRIASQKAGLQGVKVHSLRHTYATTASWRVFRSRWSASTWATPPSRSLPTSTATSRTKRLARLPRRCQWLSDSDSDSTQRRGTLGRPPRKTTGTSPRLRILQSDVRLNRKSAPTSSRV